MNVAKRGPMPRTLLAGLEDRVAASLVFGVTGLFFFNIVFGPFAIALGAVAARRHRPRGRNHVAALAGVALGVADLAVLAVVAVTRLSGGGFQWHL